MAPPSQKFRTIGFVLTGGDGATLRFNFAIRPEELRRTEPSRISVQQTLGGALVDAFGAGLSTITLSGHNGWRGGFLDSGAGLFDDLRAACYVEFHKRRAKQIAAGKDPAEIELQFVDTLDKITVSVVPMSFALMRSKSSPLLMRFSIEMTVLGPASQGTGILDSIMSALSDPLRWLASVTGLGDSLGELSGLLSTIQSSVALAQTVAGAFMSTVMNVMGGLISLTSLASSAGGILGGQLAPYLSSALTMFDAAANAFHALAAAPGQDQMTVLALITVAATFQEASCTSANGFAIGQVYRSFDDMDGASNCSSTGGGDPASPFTLAGTSPLPSIFASTAPQLGITFAAQQALNTLNGDVLLLAQNPPLVMAAMQAIAIGITVPPLTATPGTPIVPIIAATTG